MANRLRGRCGYDAKQPFRPMFHPERLDEPLRMKKPKRIAVSFMGDLWNSTVSRQCQADVLSAALRAYRARGHTFLFLTKRPENMANTVRTWLASADFRFLPRKIPATFWFGTSIANQADAEARLPKLMRCPGNLWVSYEPMQGPVRIDKWVDPVMKQLRDAHIGWVVAGGGPFPVHPQWVRDIRDQCVAANVPFWFKQWGDFKPTGRADYGFAPGGGHCYDARGQLHTIVDGRVPKSHTTTTRHYFIRVGKRAAGCMLDGKEYHTLPERR
jgi:protein gp37